MRTSQIAGTGAAEQDHLGGGRAEVSSPGWYGPAVPMLIAVLAAVVAIAGG